MSYTTGNAERDRYIDVAISKCERRQQPITVATVSSRLPDGFELDQTELDGILSNRAAPVERSSELARDPQTGMVRAPSLRETWPPKSVSVAVEEPQPKTLEKIEAPRANGAAQPSIDPAKATPRPEISHEAALKALHDAQAKLANDRQTVRAAQEAVRRARGALHDAVVAFSAGDGLSPGERQLAQVRAFQATATAERAARAAKFGDGTSERANNFARRQMRVPFGTDPNTLAKGRTRGAAPANYRGRQVAGNPLVAPRGVVLPKTGA